MRVFPAAAAAAALCLFAAGCAQVPLGGPGSSPAPSSAAPSPSPTPTWLSEEPITLTIGQPVDLSGTRGWPKAIVRVESVTEQTTCPTDALNPELGQFVAVELTAFRQGSTGEFDLAVAEWLAVDGSGSELDARATVTTGLCLPEEDQVSLEYDANGQVHGTVLLDAPTALARILIRNTMAQPPVTMTIELPPRA
ncbi:MAG: hypothetical protein LBH76_08795 [Propionibacteriaceae bacterium]|jgi:hypothetical protein|nr:hypothetical protein [Propionibacteriaceae bacterium]